MPLPALWKTYCSVLGLVVSLTDPVDDVVERMRFNTAATVGSGVATWPLAAASA
jgi:hypothetical protein